MSFPTIPTNNKIYKNFYYNSTIGAWEKRDDGSTGDIKPRASLTSVIGWLPTHGETIGNDSSGATYTGEEYRDLFNEIKLSWGNAGTEDFDAGNTVLLPDLREVGLVGVGTNTTDSILSHEPHSMGEFKDSQTENLFTAFDLSNVSPIRQIPVPTWGATSALNGSETSYSGNRVTGTAIYSMEDGTTTHGKQKGVEYLIRV